MASFNIADLYEAIADAIPDNPALVAGDVRYTFGELDRKANQLAHALAARGVGKGSHVGLHMYNHAAYPVTMLACWKLRAVPININYRYVADELKYMIDDAELVAIVSHGIYAGLVDEANYEGSTLKKFVVVRDGFDGELPAHWEDYDAICDGQPETRGFEERSSDDLFIVYTGGTTGMPKGVMWRHEDLFYAALQGGAPGGEPVESVEQLVEQAQEGWYARSMLPCAPFIHGSAQLTCWICLLTGAKLVIQTGKSFDPKRILELIAEEEVSTINIVGDAMAQPLLEEMNRGSYDLSSLMVIASAGAILSPVYKRGLQEKLGDELLIVNAFGSSESGHAGTAVEGEDSKDGRPSFFMDETCTVLDDDLNPVEPGSGVIGRLARTGHLPLGYFKDPEKTAERFVEAHGKRWVLPGDFATIEADGRITFMGRGSKCINTGGEKVFPEEVEETLKEHPQIVDALVVGVPDPRWGQKVAAVIQTSEGASLSLEDVQAHCRKHIAGYKVPRLVITQPKVERLPSGKPDYKWAEDIAAAAAKDGVE
ncbi:MAG: acyl-CoA synthetase [Myxococcales bacterium]|jgi:acyl-CoA synthetase (AMP-forming)/AMP-acid ligase II|nr:acyl-CoA synthetase [Myxococcales bacterium]